MDVYPGAAVIGEEASHDLGQIRTSLPDAPAVWLIDPLDGTKNFVNHDGNFGVIVALVTHGETQVGWISFPILGHRIVTERGVGTTIDGKVCRTSIDSATRRLRGTLYTRFMPPAVAMRVERATRNKYEQGPASASAAVEYARILQGMKDFVIYYKLLPWDHAAGALALFEAGGCVEHLDGSHYSPASPDQITIAAANPFIGATVREWIYNEHP
jgi:fructose-1,6-bisphosphatase/inositol monophosphatase family enzyme